MRRDPRETARALMEIAAGQGGCFTASQALSVGYAYPQQHYHKTCGNWILLDHGIYRLRDYREWAREDLIRWSLWSRNRRGEIQAVASHDAALDIHELSDINPARNHFTVPPGFRKRSPTPGCVFHYAILQPHEWEQRHGFRVTTPLRTLIDTAQSPIGLEFLEGAIYDALRKGLVRRAQLTSSSLPEQIRSRFQKTLLELMVDVERADARATVV